jgi:thiosulfate dehydrogenase [quinone] large subunit
MSFVLARKAARPQPQRSNQPADRWPAYGTVPLRIFLGLTFMYAGLQKVSDPGFLQPGAPTYIGSQLQGFAAHSPIGFLIASWSVQPYFLGSDGIYTVAWITLVLVGDQGVLTASPLIFGPAHKEPRGRPATTDLSRRRLLIQLGGASVALVWVLGLVPRTRSLQSSSSSATPSASASTATASPSAAATPSGTRIGSVGDLQAHGFLSFQDPGSGDQAVAVSLLGGGIVAFDALCTHAGCAVGYDSNRRLLVCPCHGAEFDPAHGAAVVAGPAPTPLTAIRIQVGADESVYAG